MSLEKEPLQHVQIGQVQASLHIRAFLPESSTARSRNR